MGVNKDGTVYNHRYPTVVRKGFGRARQLLFALRDRRRVNPYFRAWDLFPPELMKRELQRIMGILGIEKFGVAVEHGCFEGTHYTSMLKGLCDELWGVDILAEDRVRNVDRYFRMPMEVRDAYFENVADESVDAALFLTTRDFNNAGDFTSYFTDGASPSRYLSESNYYRIIKPGGHLIMVEWDTRPEKRVGRRVGWRQSFTQEELIEVYRPPEIPGFSRVYLGYTEVFTGPSVVYRRDKAS